MGQALDDHLSNTARIQESVCRIAVPEDGQGNGHHWWERAGSLPTRRSTGPRIESFLDWFDMYANPKVWGYPLQYVPHPVCHRAYSNIHLHRQGSDIIG